jgi:hypothetical protein
MSITITPKLKPLFKQKTPFYKTRTFKIVMFASFIIVVAVAVFFILGVDYSAQTLEKTI